MGAVTAMREIKFRGRNEHGWRFGMLRVWRDQSFAIETTQGLAVDFVDPATVGQFTGLTDSEGREIYEGDIIKVIVIAKSPKWDFQRNFVVEWSVDGWYMEGDPLHVWILLHSLKVIGNVHDNPSLLERKS